MERCPNCRARVEGADTCRRCGMELALLEAAEQAAEALCRRACRDLAGGDPAAAAAALGRAQALVADHFVGHLLGFARYLASPAAAGPRPRPWVGPPRVPPPGAS